MKWNEIGENEQGVSVSLSLSLSLSIDKIEW
jgi:hypothetical protein